MKYIVFLVVSMICILVGCKSFKNNKSSEKRSQNDLFSIGADCTFEIGQGIDSKVGTLLCNDIPFAYDYGRYSHPGPTTIEEDFANGFMGNFYAKFFDLIHIDAKVHRLFMDSVRILNVKKPEKQDKLLFDCTTCNAVATITFRQRQYLYPYTNDESLWKNTNYDITIDTIEGYKRKIYISNVDTLHSGVYLVPITQPRQANKLSVTTQSKQPIVRKLLRSIRVK